MFRIIIAFVFYRWYTVLTNGSSNKYIMSLNFSSHPTKHPVKTNFWTYYSLYLRLVKREQ